jgi:molybdate transport system substrate-binding protein
VLFIDTCEACGDRVATLRILSAGAAQAVTEQIIEAFRRDTGHDVAAEFSAVGAMKARVTAGEAVDVITLTQAMIDELITAGFVQPGSRFDLGKVGTGIAVRRGAPVPRVGTTDELRAAVLGAAKIVCPDPAVATAGKVVMAVMEKLGIAERISDRLHFFPNGYAAMKWLAAQGSDSDLGITQVTEILPNKGVVYAGPLPEAFQMKTVYSAGIASRAQEPQLAQDFIDRFRKARALLIDAGYELAAENQQST